MTDEEILIKIAEFDGILTKEDREELSDCGLHNNKDIADNLILGEGKIILGPKNCDSVWNLKPYFRSRDAIIPAIIKLKNEKLWSSNPADYPRWTFSHYLTQELGLRFFINGSQSRIPLDVAYLIIKATPRQLCMALFKTILDEESRLGKS